MNALALEPGGPPEPGRPPEAVRLPDGTTLLVRQMRALFPAAERRIRRGELEFRVPLRPPGPAYRLVAGAVATVED